jgi:hypothetical protein
MAANCRSRVPEVDHLTGESRAASGDECQINEFAMEESAHQPVDLETAAWFADSVKGARNMVSAIPGLCRATLRGSKAAIPGR